MMVLEAKPQSGILELGHVQPKGDCDMSIGPCVLSQLRKQILACRKVLMTVGAIGKAVYLLVDGEKVTLRMMGLGGC